MKEFVMKSAESKIKTINLKNTRKIIKLFKITNYRANFRRSNIESPIILVWSIFYFKSSLIQLVYKKIY